MDSPLDENAVPNDKGRNASTSFSSFFSPLAPLALPFFLERTLLDARFDPLTRALQPHEKGMHFSLTASFLSFARPAPSFPFEKQEPFLGVSGATCNQHARFLSSRLLVFLVFSFLLRPFIRNQSDEAARLYFDANGRGGKQRKCRH